MLSSRKSDPNEVSNLILQIPEFEDKLSAAHISARFRDTDCQILVAHNNDGPLGFTIAHSLDGSIYNLWLAGVLPEHRKKGVGTFLMQKFQGAATKMTHSKLQVMTLNRHRDMMKLLIDLNYSVIKFEHLKVTFELRITEQGDSADLFGSSNLKWL